MQSLKLIATLTCVVILSASALHAETVIWQGDLGEGGTSVQAFLPVPAAPWDFAVVRIQAIYDSPTVHLYRAGPGEDNVVDLVIPDPGPGNLDFGDDITVVQDVNGDGQPDLVVSAAVNNGSQETTIPRGFYLYHGGSSVDAVPDLEGLLLGGPYDDFGWSCVGGGDWNGDGYGDFAIPADYFTTDPKGLVYFGGPALDATPDFVIHGVYVEDYSVFRYATFHADFNNDGFDDLACSLADPYGAVGIFYGGATPDGDVDVVIEMIGGLKSITAGDMDLDGFDDLVVSHSAGIEVYRGGTTMATDPEAVFFEDHPRFQFNSQERVRIVRTDLTESHADVFTSAGGSSTRYLIGFDGAADSTATPEYGMNPNPTVTLAQFFEVVPGMGAGGADAVLVRTGSHTLSIISDLFMDHDGDGIPDNDEVVAGTLEDCDGNGLADLAEIGIWPVLDCDGNGILDVCQLADEDCDGNGEVDACQIAEASWLDCNRNDILDTCEPLTADMDRDGNGLIDCLEIHENSWLDCDGNWVLDRLQIPDADADCDSNGYTDFCEIQQFGHEDCNGDIIPDDCQTVIAGFDVDGNGVMDICELRGALDEDCDDNGRMDYWDITYHPADDCDRDGFLDDCDPDPAPYPCQALPYVGIYFDEALTVTSIDPAQLPEFGYLWVTVRNLEPGEATAVDHYSFSIVAPPELTIGGGILEPEGGALDVAGANDEFWVTVEGDLAANGSGDLVLARVGYFKTGTPAVGTGVRAFGVGMSEISNARPVWRDLTTGDHRVIDSRAAYFGGGFADCNHNGQVDSLDISGHLSPDDNSDGIPDECQLSGTPTPRADDLDLDIAPNPFNPRTTIAYRVPRSGHVRLVVYDVSGRRIRTLWDGYAEAGAGTVQWHGRDDAGSATASGIYFLRLETADGALTRKLALLR